MQDQQTPMAPISEPSKDSNKNLVVILVILIVAILIAAIVAVVVVINVNKEVKGKEVSQTEETKTAEEKKEPEKETEEEPEEEKTPDLDKLAKSRRDTQREDDIARVLTAVNNYQANNNGKIPFTEGGINPNFIKRYIDNDVVTNDGMTVTKCGDEFKDPNGKCYNFAKPEQLKANKKDALKGVTTVNNKIYVFIQARCGDGDGELIYSTSARDVALMYKMEIDEKSIACNDNY
ncbi:hypothetical protein J5500_02560 [Candidatus Saccharibacteria bacterium]|nr:hypothetical protein [Candidatus Saccharibacteria bacterium]